MHESGMKGEFFKGWFRLKLLNGFLRVLIKFHGLFRLKFSLSFLLRKAVIFIFKQVLR